MEKRRTGDEEEEEEGGGEEREVKRSRLIKAPEGRDEERAQHLAGLEKNLADWIAAIDTRKGTKKLIPQAAWRAKFNLAWFLAGEDVDRLQIPDPRHKLKPRLTNSEDIWRIDESGLMRMMACARCHKMLERTTANYGPNNVKGDIVKWFKDSVPGYESFRNCEARCCTTCNVLNDPRKILKGVNPSNNQSVWDVTETRRLDEEDEADNESQRRIEMPPTNYTANHDHTELYAVIKRLVQTAPIVLDEERKVVEARKDSDPHQISSDAWLAKFALAFARSNYDIDMYVCM